MKRFPLILGIFFLLPFGLFARGGGGCFLPDTPVLLSSGESRRIDGVRVGDSLLGYSSTGPVSVMVRRVFTPQVEGYLLVKLSDRLLKVTSEHPFYVGPDLFKTIGSLYPGDRVFVWNGQNLESREILSITPQSGRIQVYNLEVDAPNTYFAQGTLVHNKGGGCFPGGTVITTPQGPRAIETLKPGDLVQGITANGNLTTVKVLQFFQKTSLLLTLEMTSGSTLITTEEHPILRSDGTFVNAGDLGVGDQVLRFKEGRLFSEVLKSKALGNQVTAVYNLEVESPHTYLADGFAVHNKGGGGGFSGGFHSSSHSVSGSSGPMTQEDWIFMIIIILVFVALSIYFQLKKHGVIGANNGPGNLDKILSRSIFEKKAKETRDYLVEISLEYPDWNWDSVEVLFRSTFEKLQQCWESQNYSPMEPLLSAALYKQHLAQIREMADLGEVNCLRNLKIESLDPIHVNFASGKVKTLSVIFTASCQDYYVNSRTKQFLRGSMISEKFQEVWVFHYLENRWVLDWIEQIDNTDKINKDNLVILQAGVEIEGSPEVIKTPASRLDRYLKKLSSKDPIWNPKEMLDSAREIFTLYHLNYIKFLSSDFIMGDLAAALAKDFLNRDISYANFCIRSAELTSVIAEGQVQEFTVRFEAHGMAVIKEHGVILSQDEDIKAFTQNWSFRRDGDRWKLSEILTPMN